MLLIAGGGFPTSDDDRDDDDDASTRYNEAAYSLKAVAPTLFVSPRRVASPRHPIG